MHNAFCPISSVIIIIIEESAENVDYNRHFTMKLISNGNEKKVY